VWTTTFENSEPGANLQTAKKVFLRATIDLRQRTEPTSIKLPDKKPDENVAFSGAYELTVNSDVRKSQHTLRVKNTQTGKELWTREMDILPARYLGDALVLRFPAAEKYASSVIQQSSELKKRLEEIPRRQDASLLEVLNIATGKPLGYVMLDAARGSLGIRSVSVAGRILFVEDTNSNRTLAYSLDTGDRTGQEFGRVLAVDPVRSQVAVQNQLGRVLVFDRSMQRIAEFEYPRNVIYVGFDGQGRRLLTVTGSQDVFIENLP
jgi:hypothetical protein